MSIVWKAHREIVKHYSIHEYEDRVLIIGLGPIGLLAALVIRKLHPGLRCTAVDLAEADNKRAELVKSLGNFSFVHAEKPDQAPAELRGKEFQIIIEATDQPENVFRYAPSLLAPGGILVLIGISEEGRSVDIAGEAFTQFVKRGNILIGSINSSRSDFEDSVSFMESVVGEKNSILEKMVRRWKINNQLRKRLAQQLGKVDPRDRKVIKVVLEAEKYTNEFMT